MSSPLLRNLLVVACLATLPLALAACSPEVGSKEWCEMMDKKDKGNWSANEAKDYAKHCVL